jgi:hypothetical protein
MRQAWTRLGDLCGNEGTSLPRGPGSGQVQPCFSHKQEMTFKKARFCPQGRSICLSTKDNIQILPRASFDDLLPPLLSSCTMARSGNLCRWHVRLHGWRLSCHRMTDTFHFRGDLTHMCRGVS